MTMAADKQDKVLNFSSEREQSGACSSSAEHEKNQGKDFLNVPNTGKVPTLRFPEFTGNWEKTKLADITKRVLRKNKGVVSERPLTISAQYGLIDQRDFFNKVVASENLEGYYLLKKGEFAYNKSYSNEYPWGAVKRLDSYDEGALSTLYICFECIGVDGDWLVHYFDSPKWNGQVSAIAVEGARNHGLLNVGIEDFFGTQHFVPNNKKEQKKIATFLNLIDERISTQIRIIEDLKLYRDTLMIKLLSPQKDWEHVCIHDVAMVVGGGTPDTNVKEYWDGNIQWFTPSEIGKEKYAIASERTISQAGLDNSSAKLLPANTILLSTRATIGECSIAKQECCTNQGFQSLIATTVTPEFLYYLIQTKKRDLLSKASGSTFSEISANEVRKIRVCIPTTAKEQKAIVQPLSAYDEKKETECKILQLYKRQKQFLLSQMFI